MTGMLLFYQRNTVMAMALVLLLLCQTPNARISAVAVFRRDEVDLHKYSAVLAAIEPVRLQLSEDVKQSLNPFIYAFHKLKGDIYSMLTTLLKIFIN
jgi:hypothetical protein